MSDETVHEDAAKASEKEASEKEASEPLESSAEEQPTPDAHVVWFEGTAFATRPFRLERAGHDPRVLDLSAFSPTPPPAPGRWCWTGVAVEVAEADGGGWMLRGRWTALPPIAPLVVGLTFADHACTYEVRKVLPHDVRLCIVERGHPGFKLVTVPRDVVEETLRLLPPPRPTETDEPAPADATTTVGEA